MQRQNTMKRLYNWIDRKIFLYNVTFGLYMLDWWEKLLFNILVLLLLWFLCYNGSRYTADIFNWLASTYHDLFSTWFNYGLVNGQS